jgi:NADPH:quinone reductase-like Zn-dependent oxidoreductase
LEFRHLERRQLEQLQLGLTTVVQDSAEPGAAHRARAARRPGDLRPAIDSVFPLSDARAAFERSMQHGKHGKVVLRIAD